MTTSQFIAIKKTAKKADFKEMIGLKESDKTSELIDFVTLMHPNASKTSQGCNCNAFINTGEQYYYTIYTNCIIRTAVYKRTKIMYKLK